MEKKQPQKISITTVDGQPFKVPVEGSLGLMALGYKGLIAWRQVRRQYQKAREANNPQADNTQAENQ